MIVRDYESAATSVGSSAPARPSVESTSTSVRVFVVCLFVFNGGSRLYCRSKYIPNTVRVRVRLYFVSSYVLRDSTDRQRQKRSRAAPRLPSRTEVTSRSRLRVIVSRSRRAVGPFSDSLTYE